MSEAGKKVWLILISSLLFGSSVSLIISEFLITKFNINFLSFDMPGVSEKLAFQKTFDLLDFAFVGILSLIFFFVNFYASKFLSGKENNFSAILLFIFSVTAFIQTHFLIFASTQVLAMIVCFELIYFGLLKFGKDFNLNGIMEQLKNDSGKIKLQNGIFLGFIFLLFANALTTIPAFSLALLILTPLLTLSVTQKKLQDFLENFPGFFLLFALFFPANPTQLLGLLILTICAGVLISKFKPGILLKNRYINFLNPSLIIFLIAFNGAFNIGNFDSVEEGFWLAWVQRFINGEVMYRDFAVYHSPLIPWGMYLFSKFNGFNLYSERLFLHLLQVLGFVIYFFFAKKVIKNTAFAIISLFVFMAITSSAVRNNIEIRVGLPLLGLLLLFIYLQGKKLRYLIVSGVTGVVSFLLSIEAGIAVLITSVLALNIFSESKFMSAEKLKENIYLLAGILGSFVVFILYLIFTNSLMPFIEQTSFYAKAFSLGYFNTPVDRSVTHSYFHFDVFDEYLDSVTIFWEFTKLTFIGFLIFGIYKFFAGERFSKENAFVLTTSFFGLILTRAALGRSDWYHLLFVSSLALLLIFYALSKLYETQKLLALSLLLFIIFVAARPSINNAYLNTTLFKFESYGKVFGEYKAYEFDRGNGILIGSEINTQPMNELVDYIQSNSNPDEKIFVFPWNPEIYFYTDRNNATKFDTPYGFFSSKYQTEMISELRTNQPKFIIYSGDMNFGGLTVGALKDVNDFILANYKREKRYGPFDLMIPN